MMLAPEVIPDAEAARRERVGAAWAGVAGYGGPTADPRVRRALDLARAYARTGAAAGGRRATYGR